MYIQLNQIILSGPKTRPEKSRPDPKLTQFFYPIESCCEGPAGLGPDPTRTRDLSGVPENPNLLVYMDFFSLFWYYGYFFKFQILVFGYGFRFRIKI